MSRYASAQFGKFQFRNFHMKLTDCVTCARCVRLNASAMTALQQTWLSFVPSVSNNVTLYRTPNGHLGPEMMPDLLFT